MADLRGRVMIVTGARVKIGFQIALRLLRCGCHVVATTRFPRDAAARFSKENDYESWKHSLDIIGLDLRDHDSIVDFVSFISSQASRLDAIIHNACQTIRRPPVYYQSLIEREVASLAQLRDAKVIQPLLVKDEALHKWRENQRRNQSKNTLDNKANNVVDQVEDNSNANNITSAIAKATATATALSRAAEFCQRSNESWKNDENNSRTSFPVGLTDAHGQQLDLRRSNTWVSKIQEVSAPEAAEVFAINALAPFVLNSKLIPMMQATNRGKAKYIINVSAMEGKFYRYKTPNHPHTNMAKAALNMMTRTCAEDLAKPGSDIYMNSVDTGWINDENPLAKAAAHASAHNFQTPIDEIDVASRVVDPILSGVKMETSDEGKEAIPFGKFFKDYHETEW